METIEFIESYKKVGNDYQWHDNHGRLVRCKDCKDWEPTRNCVTSWCSRFECYTTEEFFCADGEREE